MFKNYVLITLRNLLKNSVYSLINITGLAIGIASSILILLWVFDELGYDKFHPKADRLYQVWINAAYDGKINSWTSVPLPTYEAMKTADPNIVNASVADWGGDHLLTVGETRIRKRGYFVGEEFITMFEFPLLQGNAKTVFNEPNSIVISQSLAKMLFKEQDPINQLIRIDNATDAKVTGVLKDVPGNVLDVFAENLATEYAAQRSFTPDDTKAAEAAQKTAFAMTVAKFPPQSWGGEMRFMSQGSAAADPEILRADVEKIVGKDVASDLWANYVPEFVTIGNQVGWQFRSKGGNRDGYPVYARNGAAFVVNPYVSDSALANATETHRRIAEELKKRQALAPYEKQSDPFKVVRFGL